MRVLGMPRLATEAELNAKPWGDVDGDHIHIPAWRERQRAKDDSWRFAPVMSQREVARRLGTTQQQVNVEEKRALRKIRERLEGDPAVDNWLTP